MTRAQLEIIGGIAIMYASLAATIIIPVACVLGVAALFGAI